jgi:putative radical SAM enzyme (TIGR03279 family)
MRIPGLRVKSVAKGLPAWKSGIRKGDTVVSVNGMPVSDEIDFRYSTAQPVSQILIRRRGVVFEKRLKRPHTIMLGIGFHEPSVHRCSNHCVFCFIDQMPKGLRKSLYVKDEDIKHSFVNGNYVTLTALTQADLERICGLGLSPLYVSVHATDIRVRRRMLGSRHIPDVMEQLRFLEKNGVFFHTQIVVCPGFNNGEVLARTMADLLSLKKGLLSIAVVPVGLTRYTRPQLRPVDRGEARRICSRVAMLGEKDRLRNRRRRVFPADELFILAGLPFPGRRYYEAFPQIENGVGLVRQFLDEWKSARPGIAAAVLASRKRRLHRGRTSLMVTSESAFPFVSRIAADLSKMAPGSEVRVCAARNEFFGGKVTVAGLLTAQDIVRAVKKTKVRWHTVAVPGVVFNFRGHTLDGYSPGRLGKRLGSSVMVVESLKQCAELV